jgi:hypothetical protein
MQKVCIGVPAYGSQPPDWWQPLVRTAYELRDAGIELVGPYDASSMMVDRNRNEIARKFLETDAEWLYWMDADNPLVLGALPRLLDTQRHLVTGLYISRSGDPKTIAYNRLEDGTYESLRHWRRGEIIPIDSAGLGCCLTHRSVYEEFDAKYVALQREAGGIVAVHIDDIQGDVFDGVIDENDGKVVDGVWRRRLRQPTSKTDVPFFALEYGRTEDMWFFEHTARLGFQLWLDTSVEVAHLTTHKRTVSEYFEWMRNARK